MGTIKGLGPIETLFMMTTYERNIEVELIINLCEKGFPRFRGDDSSVYLHELVAYMIRHFNNDGRIMAARP